MLASDKTNITTGTGGRYAHPLLISLANLDFDFRNKSSNHAFLLLALLPIPNFAMRHKRSNGVLEARIIHATLDVVLERLKLVAREGMLLADAFGNRRNCFTCLAGDIVDLPEASLLAGTTKNASPFTTATQANFGDDQRHRSRTKKITLARLKRVAARCDPWDLRTYISAAKEFQLNGVHEPFWRDWDHTDPAVFLNPEMLHYWFKAFWDHDLRWCINVMGMELNFRYAILHPRTGFRHFSAGVDRIKQGTGREHRDLMRYIVATIAGAVPPRFLRSIRALIDFRYIGQAPELDENDLQRMTDALCEFHKNKDAIMKAKARRGAKKKKVITNWSIPKLETLLSVVPSIRLNGVPINWTADTTEHEHIIVAKRPSRASNNQHHEEQICCYLYRHDCARNFDLATSIDRAGIEFRQRTGDDAGNNKIIDSSTNLANALGIKPPGSRNADYFAKAADLTTKLDPNEIPLTSVDTHAFPFTAIHLKRERCFESMSVDDAAGHFDLKDLRGALADYQHRASQHPGSPLIIGGTRTRTQNPPLPFDDIEVWTRCQIQGKTFHRPHAVLPATTVHASPPGSEGWEFGRRDPVLINTDASQVWPYSGLFGMSSYFIVLIPY